MLFGNKCQNKQSSQLSAVFFKHTSASRAPSRVYVGYHFTAFYESLPTLGRNELKFSCSLSKLVIKANPINTYKCTHTHTHTHTRAQQIKSKQ